MRLSVIQSSVLSYTNVRSRIEDEERSSLSHRFGDNEILECVEVWNDEILFHEHQILGGARLELGEFFFEGLKI